MTRYLLDSDAIIDYLKGVPDTVALLQQLGTQGDEFYTCDVVICEVFSVSLAPRHRRLLEGFVSALAYVTPSYAAAVQAGEWRTAYRSQGIQLPTTDCLIAAVAHEHHAQVITANLRDYPMPEARVLPLPRAQQSR